MFEIFILLILCTLLQMGKDWAFETRVKIEDYTNTTCESLRSLRLDLAKLNRTLNFIKRLQKTNFARIFMKSIDVVNIMLFLMPVRNKMPIIRKLLSVRLFKLVVDAIK